MCADKNDSNSSYYENNNYNSKRKGSSKNSHAKSNGVFEKEYIDTLSLTKKMDGGKLSPHLKRLNQKCLVKVKNENLLELRDSLKGSVSVNCNICGKTYKSEKKLKNHYETKHTTVTILPQKKVRFSDHVIVHEVTDYHTCRKCPKMFKKYTLLKKHMKKSHKKRKCYICHYCSKEFVDRFIFKIHIKLHCDSCGLLLPTRAKYLQHRHKVCKITKRYKCQTCNETCFNYMDLKDHSYAHIGTFYVCDICKDQFQTYCQLSHHICYLHTENHPNALFTATNIGSEKLYQCNFCEKSFAYKILFEKHIEPLPNLCNSITTSYKDHSFCDNCLTQFKTDKDMLEHKLNHCSKTDSTEVKSEKVFFKLNEIPNHYLIPKVVMTKSKEIEKKLEEILTKPDIVTENNKDIIKEKYKILSKEKELMINDSSMIDDNTNMIEKPKKKERRKIDFSNHQCRNCDKYFVSAYNLRRHINEFHANFQDYQCKLCEETFVWPSLLATHKCLRLPHPEMPFDDARPEIQIDNLYENGFDSDVLLPDPIVNIIEDDSEYIPPYFTEVKQYNGKNTKNRQDVAYKIVLQEVPIEF